jgi:cytochrome bd ubiquinol oxidase subunit I
MELDVFILSRIQFALTIMFHYIFPPLSIGLTTLMVFMEGRYLWTGDKRYHAMTRFWTGLFAVNFAMGVATGIVMEFQFGTNWAAYSRFVGDIFGSALAAEGIFAFFLESGFLAVLVFGWDRVSPRMHFIATLMVALGAIFSAVWIIIANSWQHTPAGFILHNGRAEITNFWEMVFNPSAMIRLAHVLLAAFILGSFFVMSVSAYYILRNRHLEFAKRSFTIALVFGALTSIGMPITGHIHAQVVAKTQPAKLAALEGHFKTGVADLYLFGWPDVEEKKVKYGLAVPGGLSFLVYDDFTKPVDGLDKFHPDDQPPIVLPFMTFHLMVVLGIFFIGLTLLGLFFRWRGTLFNKRWLMWIFVVAVLGPYLANESGWVSAEVGRQPFVVYPANVDVDVMAARGEEGKKYVKMDGAPHLRTRDAISKKEVVTGGQVLTSIILFSLIYLMLFVIWVYVIWTKVQHGPEEGEAPPPEKTTPEGFLTATSRLAPAAGYHLVPPEKPQPSDPAGDKKE